MRLSPPIVLRLNSAPFDYTPVSIREHLPPLGTVRPGRDLHLVTFHPGYLAGTHQGRDYFTYVAARLFAAPPGGCRLRVFTVNHPGYDAPAGHTFDRFRLEPYRVENQPRALAAVLHWLIAEYLADEEAITWTAYGHSMGGLALSQYRPDELVATLATQGRSLRFQKILAAPALILRAAARRSAGQLDVLHRLKLTLGRLPLYESVATGLYQAFAPAFYQRDADQFTISAYGKYFGFDHMNPFVLLEQGLELVNFDVTRAGGPALLDGALVILSRRDGMIDVPAMRALAATARRAGYAVRWREVEGSHLLELDAPQLVAEILAGELSNPAGGSD